MEHTKGKLKAVKHSMSTNYWTVQAVDENGKLLPVANMTCHHRNNKEANAKRLALCWNEHDKLEAKADSHNDLLAALETYIEHPNYVSSYQQAKTAIAKAKK